MATDAQKILAFQQNNSGKGKIEGIARFGRNRVNVSVVSIDQTFPQVIDDTRPFLPEAITADLVLDFLTHPDLSHDLSWMCSREGIPVVASGKNIRISGTFTPPT